jgi:hypothetical protein
MLKRRHGSIRTPVIASISSLILSQQTRVCPYLASHGLCLVALKNEKKYLNFDIGLWEDAVREEEEEAYNDDDDDFDDDNDNSDKDAGDDDNDDFDFDDDDDNDDDDDDDDDDDNDDDNDNDNDNDAVEEGMLPIPKG